MRESVVGSGASRRVIGDEGRPRTVLVLGTSIMGTERRAPMFAVIRTCVRDDNGYNRRRSEWFATERLGRGGEVVESRLT